MGTFNMKGYDSFSGCDIVVTARLSHIHGQQIEEKVYTLGSLQTISVSTHQDKRPVRAIGNINALDYTMGQRTIAGSLVFAVFDQHFASEMIKDLQKITGKMMLLADELPKLDITITFANEYGRSARMALFGVRLIDEGQVMSINDVYTENTYQFVATSLENLNKDLTRFSSNTNAGKGAYQVDNPRARDASTNTQGHDVVTATNDNNVHMGEQKILLEVEVEQPFENKPTGLAKFKLTPKQDEGFIKITNLSGESPMDISVQQSEDENYIVSKDLAPGHYTAMYYSYTNYYESNTVTFAVNNNKEMSQDQEDQIIIEDISTTSLSGVINNKENLYVSYDEVSDVSSYATVIQEVNGFKFTINNLKPETEYEFYSHNYNEDTKEVYNKSQPIRIKTLKYDDEFITGFVDYVEANNNLLLESVDLYDPILASVASSKKNNIIDSILKVKNNLSYELLIYAMKYQNEINRVLNSSSINTPKKNISNPFFNLIKHSPNAKKSNYMRVKNSRSSFVMSISNQQDSEYIGKSGERIYTYDIDSNNMRGPRYDFTFIPMEKRVALNKYMSVNVLQNLIIDPKDYLNFIDIETAHKFLAVRNKKQDRYILEAPKGVYMANNNLEVDINYLDILDADTDIYLCISNISESLDYTPFRKIKTKASDYTQIFNNYKTSIIHGSTYLMWIEDMKKNIISKPSIINTELDEYYNEEYKKQLSKILSDIRKSIIDIDSNKFIYESIFVYLESTIDHEKDIHEKSCMEILKQLNNPYGIEDIILEIYKHKFNTTSNKKMCDYLIYDKSDRSIDMYNPRQCKMSINTYDINNEHINKLTRRDKYVSDVGHAYTVVFVTDDNMLNTQGILVINNTTGNYTSYGIEVEVIK